jgi:uncharacterized protein YvpB
MVRILDVPYRSQWDQDAKMSRTDCGPACLAMVLGYYGTQVSINTLLAATGAAPGQYVGSGQLQRVARSYGVAFEYGANYTLNDLKHWIDEGKPAIALVRYRFWSQIEPRSSTQDTFTGPHFVVVVGYGDGSIYINDPNYWPPRREEGHTKAWSEELFNQAWSNVGTASFPNPNNSAIVPSVGIVGEGDFGSETPDVVVVLECTVQPGDTWAGLAGRFYNDRTRYPEILAFNNLSDGAPPYVGQELRVPLKEGDNVTFASDLSLVLGEGAVQALDTGLVRALKEKWVSDGKMDATVTAPAVLRAFVDEIARWDADETALVEHTVQPGDS